MSAGLITTQQFCKNKCLFDKHQRFLLKLLNLANLITESQQKYKDVFVSLSSLIRSFMTQCPPFLVHANFAAN